MAFPENFVWGAAAASYQIEGAAFEDGKGWSVWDMFCRKEGAVWRGHTGDVACDHYHRYQDDVAVMKKIGLQAYRLSISWPRVLPEGRGEVNAKGLEFYDRLIDALLAAEITPYVTLFHWDYPYALYLRGGWLHPNSSDWFADYTRVIVDKLSDRVRNWMTLNEPQCFVGLGHQVGIHAPGLKLGWKDVLLAGHNALLAHGKSVQAIRAAAKTPPLVGFAPVGTVAYPISDSPADVEAARLATFSFHEKTLFSNTWFADPIFFKQYPTDGLALFGADVPEVGADDMNIIAQPLDFYGVNIYQGMPVKAGDNGLPEVVPFDVGHPMTAFRWFVTPECLYWGPRFLYERYKTPVYITENGMSNIDWVSVDGEVHDPQRIDYTTRHLRTLHRAIEDGVDVRGYFHWSILDNFEWGEGYKERFGLVFVDYPTQQRIPKDSAKWYEHVIESNGESVLPAVTETPVA
ncbi:MAG: beta-glucosidase [Chloroflexi bacterium]|nr:beta-glucosidase [Chloroflexota bacterium]